MPTDQVHRAFLLGMSDAETENRIEEGILDGTIELDHLRQIEDELIDDFVFGRLSPAEELRFNSYFLTTRERKEKVRFSRVLRKYSAKHLHKGPATQHPSPGKDLRFPSLTWILGLLTALACIGILAVWLGLRDIRLSRELAEARFANGQRAWLQSMNAQEPTKAPSTPSVAKPPETALSQLSLPTEVIRLSPGLTRGIAPVPVVRLAGHTGFVWMILDLSFDPGPSLLEQLVGADGAVIWSQEFSVGKSVVAHRTTTIALPVQLLVPGVYRIKLGERSPEGGFQESETYAFRVSK